jgi:hypothetical protein
LFCAFQFAPYVDATRWPAGTPIPSNFACSGSSNTDCANFISQAYLAAGMPMNKSWYCDYPGSSVICVRGNSYTGYAFGWAFAPRNFGSTYGMPFYIGGWKVGNPPTPIGLNGNDTHRLLGNPSEGMQTTLTPSDIAHLNANMQNAPQSPWTTGSVLPLPTPPNSLKTTIAIMADPSKVGLEVGDIIYTRNPNVSDREHVVLVVGWGPYVETWAQLETIQLSALRPTRENDNLVPYIVDHGPHGDWANKAANIGKPYAQQIRGFRPYYAIRWLTEPNGSTDDTVVGIWNFAAIPTNYFLPVDAIIKPDGTELLPTLLPTVCPAVVSLFP